MVFMILLCVIGGLTLLLVVLILLARVCLLLVTVQGESMTPTLWPGDRVLVWRPGPFLRLHEGQIVLVSQEDKSFQAAPYLKRILALSGEIQTSRPRVVTFHHTPHEREDEQTWQVPQGSVFVCGDNLEHSIDSRLWGPIPRQRVLGVMLKKIRTHEDVPEIV